MYHEEKGMYGINKPSVMRKSIYLAKRLVASSKLIQLNGAQVFCNMFGI